MRFFKQNYNNLLYDRVVIERVGEGMHKKIMIVLVFSFQGLFSMDGFKRGLYEIQKAMDPGLETTLCRRSLDDGRPSVRVAREYEFRGDYPLWVGHGSINWDEKNKVNVDLLKSAEKDQTGVAMGCLADSFVQRFENNEMDYKGLYAFLRHHRLLRLMKAPTREGNPTLLAALAQRKQSADGASIWKGKMFSTVVTEGSASDLQFVLDRSDSVDHSTRSGVTPLMTAVCLLDTCSDGEQKLRAILRKNPDVNAQTQERHTALAYAGRYAGTEYEWVLAELMQRGADPSVTPRSGMGAVWYVAGRSAEWLSIMLAMGAYTGPDVMYKRTPLWKAAAAGSKKEVQLLLDLGHAQNEGDAYGHTPSTIAQYYGHDDIARMIKDRSRIS